MSCSMRPKSPPSTTMPRLLVTSKPCTLPSFSSATSATSSVGQPAETSRSTVETGIGDMSSRARRSPCCGRKVMLGV